MTRKVCDEITCPFLNVNGTTIEFWEGISNSLYILYRM